MAAAPLPPPPRSAAERGQAALRLAQDMLAAFDARAAPCARQQGAADRVQRGLFALLPDRGFALKLRGAVGPIARSRRCPKPIRRGSRARIEALFPSLRGAGRQRPSSTQPTLPVADRRRRMRDLPSPTAQLPLACLLRPGALPRGRRPARRSGPDSDIADADRAARRDPPPGIGSWSRRSACPPAAMNWSSPCAFF